MASGRVCLFGEHSDYLGLDVIAAAIDMTIEIMATPRKDNEICIDYKDLAQKDSFTLDSEIEYRSQRDYIKSSFNVMGRKGFTPNHGWDLQIGGTIPMAAGLSSSSAMTVAAVMSIAQMSDKTISKEEVALRESKGHKTVK
ncbi:MAG: GHMP family kinase ATP-binding protein [Candidatus Thorarchaeota archaeon]|jgi:galactokinase